MKAPDSAAPVDPFLEGIRLQDKAGSYRWWGVGSLRRLPCFQDLVLVPQPLHLPTHPREVNTAVRLGASQAARPLKLAIPILLATESFGMLSKPARMALAQASRLAGTATLSPGMLPGERRAATRLVYHFFSDSLPWASHDLLQADALEVFFHQEARMGDHLTAEKNTREIGGSPSRHAELLGGDNLASKIQKLREATGWQVPIIFTLGMGRVTEDIRFAVKFKADIVRMHGLANATGCISETAAAPIGLPTLCGLAEARQALAEKGWKDEIDLVIGGGIRDGADVAKALALGAKAVHVGEGAVLALGCTGCGACGTGRCPQGIATQDPKLMKKLDVEVAAQGVYNYLISLNEEIKLICAVLGKSDIAELGVEDLQAMTIEASAMTGLPLVGTGQVF